MGHIELDGDDCVVFVFPEYPDKDGNPRRVSWGEAAAADETRRRVALLNRRQPAHSTT
jgi:hypothetical protein